MAKFQRGLGFPHEGFVQAAIINHFRDQNYTIREEGFADLVCVCETRRCKWIIEAKGVTAAIGLDFRTGLGQLIQGMKEEGVNYAIAVPRTEQFLKQCSRVATWVRMALNLHFLFVDEHGNVRVVHPHEGLEDIAK